MASRGFIEDTQESKIAGRKVFIHLGYGYFTERRFTRRNRRPKKLITYALYLWNKHYPNDKVQPDESIHHKDFNAMNDNLDNLQKLKKNDHELLHQRRIFSNQEPNGGVFFLSNRLRGFINRGFRKGFWTNLPEWVVLHLKTYTHNVEF